MSLIIKTTANVWQMEKGFDIILFIDKNDVYNREYWKDECFRRINAKYPFQELFTASIINVSGKCCALLYSVYGESIRCLSLNGPQRHREDGSSRAIRRRRGVATKTTKRAADVQETGPRTIRDRLTGYRRLAVQRRFELIFRTVYRWEGGELRPCGQRRRLLPSPRQRVRAANGFGFGRGARRFKVLVKNNAVKLRKPSSNGTILPMATTSTPKSAPAKTTAATIELLRSDGDRERPIMQQPNVPVIKIIPQNIWELDTNVDIILFIDVEIVYMDDWEDKVVERVNDRFPFKDRLLRDIQIMPAGSGSVRIYRQNGVSIFCVFFSNCMTALSDWMEDALTGIKRLLAGRLQLAIQQDPSLSPQFRSNVHSNLYFFFQSVFAYDTVVLWLCGGGHAGRA